MNVRTSRRFPALLWTLAVLFQAQPGFALDVGDWLPGLRFTPFLVEHVEYESNIFQSRTDARDDLIFRTMPGFLLEYGKGPHVVSFGYRTEILKFLRHSDNDAIHQFFAGQLSMEFNRLHVLIRNDFASTTDPPGTELTGRVRSTTNALSGTAEYWLTERFGVGLTGSWSHVDFPTLEDLTRDEYLAGGLVFWRILPKTNLQASYSYGHKDFAGATFRDADRHIVVVGLAGEVTGKLSSTFRIGYESRASQRVGSPGYQGVIMGGGWTFRPTARLALALFTDRSAQESIFGNQLFYVSTTATLAATYQFSSKVSAGARLVGGENRYPGKEPVGNQLKERRDTLLGWGAGIGYDVRRWLKVGMEYTHTSRDSNFPEFTFEDDKVGVTATLRF